MPKRLYKRHEERLSAARKRVREMDQIDGKPNRGIQTIVMALKAGLESDINHEAAYDALYMLIDIQSAITIRQELNNVNMKEVFMALDLANPV